MINPIELTFIETVIMVFWRKFNISDENRNRVARGCLVFSWLAVPFDYLSFVGVWMYGASWDEADEWGRGPAYDTIVNAVNNHGQSKVALVVYSHGGGTVYNVAWRLNNNYQDSKGNTINKPFELVFTSYRCGYKFKLCKHAG